MSRRRKKKKGTESVELNLAAMLDMAFQLLTFFILTFKPAPVEGQISLRMPPALGVVPVKNAKDPGKNTSTTDPAKGLNTLAVSVYEDKNGSVTMMMNDLQIRGLTLLDNRLRELLGDEKLPYDQVLIQANSNCRYETLMGVVDICTRQKVHGKENLSKLSFQELVDTE